MVEDWNHFHSKTTIPTLRAYDIDLRDRAFSWPNHMPCAKDQSPMYTFDPNILDLRDNVNYRL
jgi:hypothetical protein